MPSSGSATFDLSAADPVEQVQLFTLGTTEVSTDWDDLLIPRPISVNFVFSSPATGGTTAGVTGSFGLGYVIWDNPLLLPFDTTGLLSISLSNALFGVPGSAPITATFQLLSAGSGYVGVPEPSSILMMGAGLVALCVGRRRRTRRTS
jgi:hypothetical protein